MNLSPFKWGSPATRGLCKICGKSWKVGNHLACSQEAIRKQDEERREYIKNYERMKRAKAKNGGVDPFLTEAEKKARESK